jgi:hypothetical protein
VDGNEDDGGGTDNEMPASLTIEFEQRPSAAIREVQELILGSFFLQFLNGLRSLIRWFSLQTFRLRGLIFGI